MLKYLVILMYKVLHITHINNQNKSFRNLLVDKGKIRLNDTLSTNQPPLQYCEGLILQLLRITLLISGGRLKTDTLKFPQATSFIVECVALLEPDNLEQETATPLLLFANGKNIRRSYPDTMPRYFFVTPNCQFLGEEAQSGSFFVPFQKQASWLPLRHKKTLVCYKGQDCQQLSTEKMNIVQTSINP